MTTAPANLDQAKALANDFLERDDPQTAMGCLTRFLTPELLRENTDLSIALVQATTRCTIERVRNLIARLPNE